MARFPHKNPGGAPRALPRFDRRVGALAVVALCVLMTLALQVFRLSVVEHTAHAENVERHLVRKRLLPASRGRILDRNGVVLAADRASWTFSSPTTQSLAAGRPTWRDVKSRPNSDVSSGASFRPQSVRMRFLRGNHALTGCLTISVQDSRRRAELIDRSLIDVSTTF